MDQDLLAVFIKELREHLENLEPALVALAQNDGDKTIINLIFRSLHSIKGAAGFFGLEKLSQLSHKMESVAALIRDEKLKVDATILQALTAGKHKIREMVADFGHNKESTIQTETAALQNILDQSVRGSHRDTPLHNDNIVHPSILPPILRPFTLDTHLLQNALEQGHLFFVVTLLTHRDIKDKGKLLTDYFDEIENLGTFLDVQLDISSIKGLEDALAPDLCCQFFFSTSMQRDFVYLSFSVPEEQIVEIRRETIEKLVTTSNIQSSHQVPIFVEEKQLDIADLDEPTTPAQFAAQPPASTASTADDTGTLVFSTKILNELMQLTSEMVLRRNQLLRSTFAKDPSLSGIIEGIDQLTSTLREKIIQLRLQPIEKLFENLRPKMHALARQFGKNVQLEIQPNDVAVDQNIIHALNEPLLVLFQNALKHGIETSDVRTANGKHPEGHIRIETHKMNGNVVVDFVDDGGGVDPAVIKNLAVKAGIIHANAANQMIDRQLLDLVFSPNFPDEPSAFPCASMCKVRKQIEALGGNITLESALGIGVRVRIRIPLTSAIVSAMIVEANGRKFAIAQESIEEVARLGPQCKLEYVNTRSVLQLRDHLLPVVDLGVVLSNTLGTPPDAIQYDLTEEKRQKIIHKALRPNILIIKTPKLRFGLLVDTLLDSEEIVVQHLSPYFKPAQCYSGMALLGDGKVAMILDTEGIAQLGRCPDAHNDTPRPEVPHVSTENIAPPVSLLFVNDGGTETFAFKLDEISRIEKADPSRVEYIGDTAHLQHEHTSLRLISMGDPVRKLITDTNTFYVLIPKMADRIGIVAKTIMDVSETQVTLDTTLSYGKNILGTANIHGKMVLFVNVPQLLNDLNA